MPAAFAEQSAGQLHPLLCGCCPEGIFTLISIAYFSGKILLFPKDIPKKDRRMDFPCGSPSKGCRFALPFLPVPAAFAPTALPHRLMGRQSGKAGNSAEKTEFGASSSVTESPASPPPGRLLPYSQRASSARSGISIPSSDRRASSPSSPQSRTGPYPPGCSTCARSYR